MSQNRYFKQNCDKKNNLNLILIFLETRLTICFYLTVKVEDLETICIQYGSFGVDDFELELKMGFLDEASQSLAEVEQCFLSLESDPENEENLNKIFRLAHNLKGSSKAVGFDEMGEFTHEFETFILKIKNKQMPCTPKVVTFLLKCNDHILNMVNGLKENLSATFNSHSLIEEMKLVTEAAQNGTLESESVNEQEPVEVETASISIEQPEPQIDVVSASSQDIQNQIQEVLDTQAKRTPMSEVVVSADAVTALESFEDAVLKITPATPASSANSTVGASAQTSSPAPEKTQQLKAANENQKSASTTEDSIRISINKVDELINTVGEMVILQSVLFQQVSETNSMALKKTALQLGKISKEMQDLSMSLRLIPVKGLFQKMQRIVRDTAQTLGKDVQLVLSGEETELDKTVLEKINDPLVHIIRNSVDHGIESKEKRLAAGKSAKGRVDLMAYHQAGMLVIEIRDDGGGLDAEKLIKKATEKGLIKPGTQMTEQEAFNLIFAPGFSTKEQVTDVSGRGVGMDVVKTNVKELSGSINIESKLGVGTTFKVTLPLTLSIIEGLVVTANSHRYVIPLNHVHETLKPLPNQIQLSSKLGEILLIRGENLPMYRISEFFGQKSQGNSSDLSVLIIRNGSSNPWALVVDEIINQQQVVTKQLGQELPNLTGISGSTILGDGKPALILEPQELLKRSFSRNIPQQTTSSDSQRRAIA